METPSVSLTAALIAGLLSFFSPCVLPLVPIYLGYMTGAVTSSLGQTKRLPIVMHALFFVLGFGLIFVLMGAAAGWLGGIIYTWMPYIVKIGGALLIVFGLHMTGLISIPLLNMEKRLELQSGQRRNYWTSFLVGVVFAAGWTPCIGPVLSAILLLAADSQTATTGALLLSVYTLGLGIPFIAVAALIHLAIPALRKAGKWLRIASIVGGVLLIVMGVLLITGLFATLTFWLNSLTFAE